MMRSWVAVVVCSAVFFGLTGAATPPDNSGAANSASDFRAFFSFVAAAPLAPRERDQLARATEAEARVHPDEVQNADAALRKFLAALAKDQPLQRADLREQLRLKFENLGANDALRLIVDKTDPVIVFDRPKNRLITEGTLAAWQRAGVWMADLLSVPRPGDDFIVAQRNFLKSHYTSLSDKEQDVVAHVERNYPAMVAILDRAPAAKRSDFVTSARPQALDRSQFGMRLADAMAQFYDVALRREFMARLVGDMAVLNTGLLNQKAYNDMVENIGNQQANTNAAMAHMMPPVYIP
jgi:hypothetical protein